ncbi:ankyrin repeat and MYND domain-containing protein 1 [Talpa occidentalis]|uniref:ankyrin repeat and MYND domain-containing protein 1 n=1 Tax=Talpa occidentalis TaxID=50954 RepID=UPI0023F625C9|nr:ankyrin repeat and MYND domain-containing protein 1 [Talpa occidentalis]
MEGSPSPLASDSPGAPRASCPVEQLQGAPRTEDLRILGSSTLFSQSDTPEAPEDEEEEPQSPPGEQGLKDTPVPLAQGMQEWPDGCVYRGQFGLGMKLGHGEFSWPTGERYHGQFYRDHRHGLGTYEWPQGSSFTGTFYLSSREGYGTMFLKARLFQGLYKADERFGPGVETYPDGCQDVGLWLRDHLIQLCTEVPGAFSIRNYPEFQDFLTQPTARVSLADKGEPGWGLSEEQDPLFYDYKRFLLSEDLTLPPELSLYSTDSGHLPMTSALCRDLDSRIFLNGLPPFVEDAEPWLVRNETPLLLRMQRHAYRFRNKRAHSSWRMDAILAGDRSSFGPSGPKECLSKELILKAQEGDYRWVHRALRESLVSPDVADARGYTVLAAAAVHSQRAIVSLLLDSGADVNKRSDEGLTPLSMCILLYYPAQAFRPNIAERTLPSVQDGPKLPAAPSRSSVAPQGVLGSAHEDLVSGPSGLELWLLPVPLEDEGLSQESSDVRSSPPRRASLSPKGSVAADVELGPEGAPHSLDELAAGSHESDFQSDMTLQDFSIRLSRDLLERGAQALSLLPAPLGEAEAYKGATRRMALSLMERRSRWLTITLLLQRGADPNLSRVPMHVLFLAVKAADVDGVRLLLESGARTDIAFPAELRALTPLHIAAALPGPEGVRITELLLHAVTDVDARAADRDEAYKPGKLDSLPSSLKLSSETGPPSCYHGPPRSAADEGGRTALHVACEREDSATCARDVVQLLLSHRANPNTLWSGHSPLSLSIASGNDLVVKELLAQGADPNLLLTRGLGSALCVACDINFEHQRSLDSKLALIDRLLSYGADILQPVTLTQGDRAAVGTAVDYGYFRFFQDRKIAHCAFHALLPAERETFLARKRLLEYMGVQLRHAVQAKESQWDPKALYLSKRAELLPHHRLKRRSTCVGKAADSEEQQQTLLPFFKFCYQCGRSVGVHLAPCLRCYGILTCSKHCKSKAWADFHKRDCGDLLALRRLVENGKPPKPAVRSPRQEPRQPAGHRKTVFSSYSHG